MRDKTISLNAVLKLIDEIREHYTNYGNLLDIAREVRKLPPVTPQPNEYTLYMEYMRGFNKGKASRPKGHFIYEPRPRLINETDDGCEYITDYWCRCSECGGDFGFIKMDDAFCKFCGARMVGDEE